MDGTHCKTASGRRWFVLDMVAGNICVGDIAAALSRQCRFNGHLLEDVFYSVAQHAVIVAHEVMDVTGDADLAFWGLHHDDEEAYLGDLVRPVKKLDELGRFRAIAEDTQRCIAKVLGMGWPEPPLIGEIDRRMCGTEQRDLTASWIDGRPPSYDAEPYPHIRFLLPGEACFRVDKDAVAACERQMRVYSLWSPRKAARIYLETHERLNKLRRDAVWPFALPGPDVTSSRE